MLTPDSTAPATPPHDAPPPVDAVAPIRILAFSDSESYLKWATRLLGALPAVDAEVVLVDTPILPTPEQVADAVVGSSWEGRQIRVVPRAEVAAEIARHRPDIVLGSATGPVVAQVFASAVRLGRRAGSRPGLVSGLPGMGLPATAKGARYRRLTDMFIAHSVAEAAAYERAYAEAGVPAEVVLGRLPMLGSPGVPCRTDAPAVDTLVFAPQAKVPEGLADRTAIIAGLASVAEAHPGTRVIVKGRSRPGEQETHHEHHPYHRILTDLRAAGTPGAAAVEVAYGPVEDFLVPGSALLTVSSTAALESIDRGIPTGLISDFGFSTGLLNAVFEDSGACMSLAELTSTDEVVGLPYPSGDWLSRNYFHSDDGGLLRALGLLALRSRENQLPDRHRALLKQQRTLLRADLRTVSPGWAVSAYRRIRWGERSPG